MAEERLQNYTIGEAVELPSKGLIYDKPVNSTIELRSMTARDEMKRLNPSSTQFKALADIIEGCLVEKPAVHVYDMALGDYEFLLHKLRIVTYGDEYKMGLRCPYCGETIEPIAHLEQLDLKEFDYDKFIEAKTINLPRSGHTVTLKFQTPRMLDEIESRAKDLKRKYKNAEVAVDLLVLLTNVIDTVDGEKLDSTRLETFVNNLPALDMTKIINSVDIINGMIGVDNNITVDCPKCGGEVHTSFRFGAEFFRPTNI